MFEFYIAKRYLKSKHKLNFITIISILSTLGITIGVAALVIVLSVFNGFGSLVTSVLVNFDPHIRVTIKSEKAFTQLDTLPKIFNNIKEINSYYPYAEGKVILLHKNSMEILNLKGTTEHKKNDSWGIKNNISFGSYDLYNNAGINKIVLGLPIALRLSSRIGDTLSVTSANKIEQSIVDFSIPQTRKFIVSGIFEISNKEYAMKYVYTSLKSAQLALNLGNQFTGYEIRLKNINDSEKVKKILEQKLNRQYFTISTWYDLHKDLYTVMLIERWSALIILSLIIAVATFNILGSLTMSVIEKRKDIGVLRSMGASKKSILRIFMFEGILIGIIGTFLGLAIGLVVCYLQIYYNFYPLDASKYIIDALPVKVQITDILVIGFLSFLLTFIASLFPAKRAVELNVSDAIRWE
ncbi:lipoprotein-releasing system transmembrane protein LolC [bacterium BMS3Abin04]|nr:lipoprotein-releasing system transmembrane protein LolC [bacterium BMS3Abin04]